MSEVKDPAIKLFGRTILLPHSINHCSSSSASEPAPARAPSSSSSPREVTSSATQQQQHETDDEEPSRKKHTSSQHDDDDVSHQTTEDLKSPTTSSGISENPKTPSAETETSIPKEQSETTTSASDEKTPKKPDKVLPCPRCNSMDTKFCYYNNYNVNQPRYFCKNCQRYWTAGGTTRNVPVGAGRRKNKTCSSATSPCYRHIVIPEGTVFGNRATVLSFGHDSPPICDTMTSMLSIVERAAQNCVGTSGHSAGVASVATTSTSSHTGSHESVNKSLEGFAPQSRYFPSSHWPYHPHMAPPTFFPPNYPLPFYTTPPYWSCMPPSWSNNISCISPQSSVNNSVSASASSASTLGKHSRDGNIIASSNLQRGMHHVMEHNNNSNNGSEHGFLFPKTLRIDDPSEAAKRSISMWPKLGIKNDGDNNKASSGGGLFSTAFPYPSPSKGNDDMNRHRTAEASPVLQANPAALSRSLTFHEQT